MSPVHQPSQTRRLTHSCDSTTSLQVVPRCASPSEFVVLTSQQFVLLPHLCEGSEPELSILPNLSGGQELGLEPVVDS